MYESAGNDGRFAALPGAAPVPLLQPRAPSINRLSTGRNVLKRRMGGLLEVRTLAIRLVGYVGAGGKPLRARPPVGSAAPACKGALHLPVWRRRSSYM